MTSDLEVEKLREALSQSEQRYWKLQLEFERRLQEQTAQLQTANEQLQWRLAECQRAYEASQTAIASLEEEVRQQETLALQQSIPEQGQAQYQQAETLSLLQATLESTADAILVVTRQGRVLCYNQKFVRMWGMPEALLAPGSKPGERFEFLAHQTTDPEGFKARVLELFDRLPEAVVFDFLELKDGRILERYSQPQWLNSQIVGRVWSYRDITERKRAEEALQHRELQLRLALDAAQMGSWECNAQTGRVYWSEQSELLFGLQPGTFPGTSEAFLSFVHPGDREAVVRAIAQTYQEGMAYRVEYRIIRPDGICRWIAAHGSLIRESAGARLVGIGMDITERKQTEEALRQREKQLQLITDSLPVCISYIDAEQRYRFVNKTYESWFGYAQKDLYGKTLLEVIGDAAYQVVRAQVERALSGEFITYEARIPYQQGGTRYIDGTLVPDVDSETQQMKGYYALIADITERKQAEEALRESQAMLRLVIDNVPQRILWKDQNSIYLGCNRHQAAASGLSSPEEIIGKTDYDLPWTPEEAEFYRASDRRVMETNQPEYQILESQHQANGKVAWLSASKIPLHDADGNVIGILGTVEDITEHKRAEEVLRLQAQREQALNCVIQAIRNSLDLTTIFSTATTEIGNLLQVDRVDLVRYVPKQKLWRVVDGYRRRPDFPEAAGIEISDENNPITDQLKRLEVVQLEDASLCEDDINQRIARDFPGAWLLIPLCVGEGLWGCLTLMRHETPLPWQNSEVELARVVTDQLAIAIQQSELYQQVQQLNLNLEVQVQERTAQLRRALEFEALLQRITDKVHESLDEKQILQAAVKELALLPEVQYCNTAVHNPVQQTFVVHYECAQQCSIVDSYQTLHMIIPAAEYPEIYAQLQQGLSFQFCTTSAKLGGGWFTFLICPMRDEHSVPGDLLLVRDKTLAFDAAEMRLVQQVANQCAISIRQARLYQAAQVQVEELERLNRLKDDFLSTVSHELRTPMASIQMATQLLEVALAQPTIRSDDPRIRRYLKILQSECTREIRLINDLLDLSRLDAGTEPLTLTPINPQLWISHIAEPFLERMRKQQQTLLIQTPNDLPELTTDLTYLERILTELLQNAHKYTPPEEVITVSAQVVDEMLQIQVSNSGVEVPEEECDRIFDKFYRIPNADPWKYEGTGLGLALVKKLVSYLKGSIRVESGSNQTTFIIELPSLMEY